MRAIRRTAYLVASHIDKALVGIPASILHAPGGVAASLCLVRLKQTVAPDQAVILGRLAMSACKQAFRPGNADRALPAFPVSRVPLIPHSHAPAQ